MLLAMAMAYLARIRSDAGETAALLNDAQARLMFQAALMYLQEGSRLGWSDAARETAAAPMTAAGWREGAAFNTEGERTVASRPDVPDRGGETFGWTDVRNGWLGPVAARVVAPGSAADGYIPTPAWWRGYVPFPEDGDLGPFVWPMPGSATRIDFRVAEIPPYAVHAHTRPTPMFPDVMHLWGTPSWDTPWSGWDPGANTTAWNFIWRGPQYRGALDPQPVMDSWSTFQAGGLVNPADPSQGLRWRDSSRNKSWFRIYREKLGDHDGDGTPYYDRVRISENVRGVHINKNWNVFVITAGAGATRGYRFWSEVPAAEQGQFANDPAFFDALREQEVIQWWRVEWSPITGGGDPATLAGGSWYGANLSEPLRESQVRLHRWMPPRTFGGNFKWIQRLDPPATWIRNGNW